MCDIVELWQNILSGKDYIVCAWIVFYFGSIVHREHMQKTQVKDPVNC